MPEILKSLMIWFLVTKLSGFIIQPFRSNAPKTIDGDDFEASEPVEHSSFVSFFALIL